ncbi:MAG: restriction endonuclease subunit S [Nostoc sp. DedQUE12b]|uniref:restriction endonuclease subunit S n=1 Tax=Nostoc sp. DedQUE12b TaxID=3075398 RepID=UPI002AD37F9A|nr:restriction endonuclease subunit S [Nostoc sp. DedQUE12b]MDZ8086017.1 restriction endonuclease subunit S [Nostoc sp. DedQUE12b]
MQNKWTRKTIAECAANELYSTQIGPFGKALTPEEYTLSGVPLLRGVNVNHGRFYDDGFVFISEKTADRLSKFESYPGDVLLVHKGTLGQIGLMPKDRKYHRYIMGNSMLRVRCDATKLIPEYLYYWLCSSEGQHYLFSRVSQVGVPQIQRPLTTLREASLPVPPLDEQKAIVHILGTLDDKIELNREMNQTLEAMAQAIFKSWFVDFDPVHAKMEGRQPAGMDAATADLFPDQFEESALGMIPKGWEVWMLGDLINIKHGYAFKGEFFRTEPPGDILLTPGNFAINGGFKDDKFKYYVGEVPEDFVLDEGELIITMTDLSKAGDTLGYPAIIPPLRSGRYLHNQRLGKVILKPNFSLSKLHLYYLLRTDIYRNEILASATGTTVKHTSPDRIKAFKFPFIDNRLSVTFGKIVEPLYKRIILNDEQSRTLASIRDTLMPKLILGEIRVNEANNFVNSLT